MKEKWFSYMKDMLINTICFFVIWILLDLLLGDEINLRETIIRSVLFALISVPIMVFLRNRTNKIK